MIIGDSSFFSRQRIQSPEVLLGSQEQDKDSGLTFRKRVKINQYSNTRATHRNNDRYDLEITSHLSTPPENVDTLSTITGASSVSPRILDLPPDSVPPSNYMQYIPSHISPNEKMRQLLIWYAKKELKLQTDGKNPITEKVKREIIQNLESSPSIVSWNRQVDVYLPIVAKNPKNIEYEQTLKKCKNDIVAVKQKIQEWKRVEDKVYGDISLVHDKVEKLKKNNYKVDESLDFVNNLEPDQQTFINQFLNTEPEYDLSDVVSSMDSEVTQFRNNLYIANQFRVDADKAAKLQLSKLAKIFHEKTTLLPVTLDDKDFDLFDKNTKKIEQEKIKNTENLFRLLSKKK